MDDTIPREIRLVTANGSLEALEWGRCNTQPLLAVHGWLDNAASFLGLGKYLEMFHMVAIDLPGHGWSDHRGPQAAYHLVDYVADLLDVADALGWERFGLLGHSLGAGIASVFAGTFPERVTELFLIDGIGPMSCNPDGVPAQLQEALLRHRELTRRESRVFPDLATAVQARQRTGDLGRESAECLVKRAVMQVDGGYSWRHDHRLILPSRLYMTEEQVLAFLRSITAPTLLVRSSNGLINRFKPNQRIASIPGISVVELTGGHHLHMNNPFPVAREIEEFHNSLFYIEEVEGKKSEKPTL